MSKDFRNIIFKLKSNFYIITKDVNKTDHLEIYITFSNKIFINDKDIHICDIVLIILFFYVSIDCIS